VAIAAITKATPTIHEERQKPARQQPIALQLSNDRVMEVMNHPSAMK